MTLAEFVDKLAKEGTIDGNIAELIMSYHRKESKVPSAAIRGALMPIVGEMDEYHARCAVEVQCAHDKFWDEHEPQTIGDFSDRITDAVANLCGEIASNEVRERYKNARPIEEERATSGDAAKLREALEQCANWGEQIDCQLGSSDETVYAFRDERCLAHNISECARAALSAPPRNCDRFATVDEARKAHEEYRTDYIMRASNIFDFPMEFEAWLFAPAAEKEGGNDGNE